MAHAWARQRTGGTGGLSGFTSTSESGPTPGASTDGNVDVDQGDEDDDAASSEG